MNKLLLSKAALTIVLLLTIGQSGHATSWRINNNASRRAHFADINAAMSSADVVAGDTLYMDPGTSLAGDQTVTKQVTIVGPGFFRGDAPHAFAYFQNRLYITASNTKVEGIIMSSDDIYIRAQNVTIERCKFRTIYVGDSEYDNARYATIRQCYGGCIDGRGNTSNVSAYCTVENCILIKSGWPGCLYELYIPTIRHNYLKETEDNAVLSSLDNAIIQDNIILNSKKNTNLFSSVTNISDFSHNVMSCAETTYSSIPSENNKYGYTSEADIFTLTGQNDQRYQLKDDSPAKNYASEENGGGDCGPYGGLTPYVAGGMPNGYPYYTKAIIPAKSKNGKVNVSLKIKTQNE